MKSLKPGFFLFKSTRKLIWSIIRLIDNEDRELIIRYRLWKMNWFPYRTAEILDINVTDPYQLAQWEWNAPLKWRRFRAARNANRQSPNSK